MTVISIPTHPFSQSGNRNTILYEQGWKSYYAQSSSGYLSIKSFFFGNARYTVERSHFAVNDRVYLVLNHGQPYTIEIENEREMESFCLFFAPGFAESIQRSLTTQDNTLLEDPLKPVTAPILFFERTYPHDQILSPALLYLKQILAHRVPTRNWLDESLHRLMTLLLQVQMNVYKEVEGLPAARAATREELYRRVYLAKDYADALFRTQVTLTDMAQVACLSPNHLLRTFKQVFRTSPHKYIMAKRLEYACKLLQDTDYPVTDICIIVGFESLGTFSWSFRRCYGLSPTEYRQENR